MIFSAYTREFCPRRASLRPSKMLIKCATPWKYEEEFFVLAPDHSQVFCKLLQCRAYLLNLFKLISSPKRLFKASNCFAILFKARQYYSRPVCKIMLSTNEISRDLGWRSVLGTLRWLHNGCDSVSNHQPRKCLLRRLIRRTSKKTSKLRVTGLCAGNSPGTGEFPAQMASNAEKVSIWWRHHEISSIHNSSHTMEPWPLDIGSRWCS